MHIGRADSLAECLARTGHGDANCVSVADAESVTDSQPEPQPDGPGDHHPELLP